MNFSHALTKKWVSITGTLNDRFRGVPPTLWNHVFDTYVNYVLKTGVSDEDAVAATNELITHFSSVHWWHYSHFEKELDKMTPAMRFMYVFNRVNKLLKKMPAMNEIRVEYAKKLDPKWVALNTTLNEEELLD